MGSDLPVVSEKEFGERLRGAGGRTLSDRQVSLLFLHYEELRRWNRTVSLVGPGDGELVVERHYGESLAAGPLLGSKRGLLLDVGSGAGFPGFVIAVAFPWIDVVLAEAKARKWSFLKSVCRHAGLATQCLNVRVGRDPAERLPTNIDWVTTRAVRLEELGLETLMPRMAPRSRLLYWAGSTDPRLRKGLRVSRQIELPESSSRRILEIVLD